MNYINKTNDELIRELQLLKVENEALKKSHFLNYSKNYSQLENEEGSYFSKILLESEHTIQFQDLFDINELQTLQDRFADATGVASLITDTNGLPITQPSNFTRLCNDIIRQTEIGCENCFKSDAEIGKYSQLGPIVQPCLSGGLWDAGAAIVVGGKHVGNWLIGQVRDETQTEEKIKQYAIEIGANEDEMLEAFRQVPSMTQLKFENIAKYLFVMANHLSKFAYHNIIQAQLINEKNIVENELRESKEKLSALFSSMTEMVVLHQLIFDDNNNPINYKILDCNKAFEEITGIKREIAIGKLATEVYQTEIAPYLEEFSQVATSGEPYEYTSFYAPMDKHFSISVVSPQKNQFATVTTDITAIKQIQDLISEKNKELENYLYVASHDLRSPLVNIQGFSRRLQKNVDTIASIIDSSNINDEVREKVNVVIKETIPKTLDFVFNNVSKMDVLINGLLQISRTGRVMMNIKQIEMNELVQNIIKSKDYQLVEIEATINVEQLNDCFGDENLLNQLFSNIIANAINYRDSDRKLNINIKSQNLFKKIIYSITDNGIGIADRHKSKVWDVFFRVNSQSNISGEGLGLSIVKRIVDKHKGRIWLESVENQGTTFYIELLNYYFSE